MQEETPEPTDAPSRLGAGFARVWTASTVSNLADGVLKVAVPVLAVRFTDSPLLVAGVGFAMSLPWLLFALHAGAIADRVDRRRAMLLANGCRGVVVALLAVAVGAGLGSLWMLYLAGVLIGMAEVFYDTSSQSILPQVVGRSVLPRANSRLYLGELAANNFVGPPLGGFLIAASATLALGVPAALWAVAVAALATLPGSFRVERTGPPTSLATDIREGFGFLIAHPVLRTMAAMTGTSNFASSMAFSIFVLFAVGPGSAMGLTEPQYGVLITAGAIGSVLGSLFATRLAARLGRARSLALGVVLMSLHIGTPALTTNPWLIGAAWALSGAAIALWNVIVVSLRQQITPDPLLGRMNSCYRLLAWGMIPIGSLAGGLLAEAFGLPVTFAVAAAVNAVTALGLFVVRERAIEAAEAAVAHTRG
jgi:MFS family permease